VDKLHRITTVRIENFQISKPPAQVSRSFIIDHHYSGSCVNGPMAWGCYHDDTLVGVIAFATPISEIVRKSIWADPFKEEMKNYTTELHRLVTLDETPHNTESWLISRGLKRLKQYKPKYKAVISFADPMQGHEGTIYQASNAIYYGTTSSSTAYRKPDGTIRHKRSGGKNMLKADAIEQGLTPIRTDGKHRYLFLTPDPYESKDDIRANLDINEQPYPK